MERIYLGGSASTLAVMNWIEKNGCPQLSKQRFVFDDKKSFYGQEMNVEAIVSRIDDELEIEMLLEDTPLDEWHKLSETQRRLHCQYFSRGWHLCVCGKFYWLTI